MIGLHTVRLRDEIYLQLIHQLLTYKQVVGNDTETTGGHVDTEAAVIVDRLWRCLGCCLSYFPCSKEFENYLELFLLAEIEEFESHGRLDSSYDSRSFSKLNASGTLSLTQLSAQVQQQASSPAVVCVRLLHETVYRFGYGATPQSFAHEHRHHRKSSHHAGSADLLNHLDAITPLHTVMSAYRHPAGLVSVSDVSAWLNTSITTPSLHSKVIAHKQPPGIQSREQLLQQQFDVHHIVSHGANNEQMTIRCSLDSWLARFHSVFALAYSAPNSNSHHTPGTDANLMMCVHDMVNALTNSDAPAFDTMDAVDKHVLLHVVLNNDNYNNYNIHGQFIRKAQLKRELAADECVFHYPESEGEHADETESIVEAIYSVTRRQTQLSSLLGELADLLLRDSFLAKKSADAKINSVIRRCVLSTLIRSFMYANSADLLAHSSDPKATITRFWNKIIDELYLLLQQARNNNSSTASGLDQPQWEIIKQAFVQNTHIAQRNRPSPDAHQLNMSVPLTHINWELYRELILVCMELACEPASH
jgi:hypothetical protein